MIPRGRSVAAKKEEAQTKEDSSSSFDSIPEMPLEPFPLVLGLCLHPGNMISKRSISRPEFSNQNSFEGGEETFPSNRVEGRIKVSRKNHATITIPYPKEGSDGERVGKDHLILHEISQTPILQEEPASTRIAKTSDTFSVHDRLKDLQRKASESIDSVIFSRALNISPD